MLATALALLAVLVPNEAVSMFNLIGSATTGVAIFVTGLIIAAYQIKMTMETAGNTVLKMLVQPALMAGLVLALGITEPLAIAQTGA